MSSAAAGQQQRSDAGGGYCESNLALAPNKGQQLLVEEGLAGAAGAIHEECGLCKSEAKLKWRKCISDLSVN